MKKLILITTAILAVSVPAMAWDGLGWDNSGGSGTGLSANAVEESHLKAVNTPTDEYCLEYEATTGDFEWEPCTAGSVEDDIYGAGWDGDTTNSPSQNAVYDKVNALPATAGDFLTLTGTDMDLDAEVTIDTKCAYWEDPVDTDDFKSVWSPNGFAATITKIWCESDQTVNMDLQIDDGTPADVAGTDLVCDSTPAEDEAGLTGSMADGDRLDFVVTSVSGTPTWNSICWTFTKVD